MKTVYEKPEINRLLLEACDVIVSSGLGLKTNNTYDTTTSDGNNVGYWGRLWD